MSQTDFENMLSGDRDDPSLRLTPAARKLLARMRQAFDACRTELAVGESLLRTFGEDPRSGDRGSEVPGSEVPGTSVFNHPELRGMTNPLERLEARCREGVRDPALRELAEHVASQSSAMILWMTHFLFDFGERLRALEGAIEAGSDAPEPSGPSA